MFSLKRNCFPKAGTIIDNVNDLHYYIKQTKQFLQICNYINYNNNRVHSWLCYDKNQFGEKSQTHHEVTMYYPMRAIRTKRYKLIHNINYKMPFPIDQDFYVSPTFQDLLNRTRNKQSLPWFKTLENYYERPEWELYDLKYDPEEKNNIASKSSAKKIFFDLQERLLKWQKTTEDPWLCAPRGVLIGTKESQCMPLENLI